MKDMEAGKAGKVELKTLGLPTNPETRQGNRTVKLARPICQSVIENGVTTFLGCEDATIITSAWWEKCPHNPYESTITMRSATTKTEPVTMEDGTVRHKVVGTEVMTWEEQRPNFMQVANSRRINSGRAVEHFRTRLGWKHADEVGYAPFCQFSDCWSQDIKFRTSHGDYCSENQAKLIAADENEDQLEILEPKKRARQLAAIGLD